MISVSFFAIIIILSLILIEYQLKKKKIYINAKYTIIIINRIYISIIIEIKKITIKIFIRDLKFKIYYFDEYIVFIFYIKNVLFNDKNIYIFV